MKILLLPITPLLSIVPAKYRLPPMPPPPCSARSPAPAGRTFGCAPILLYCCCPSFLQNIGCRRCPHHRAPHGPQLRNKRPPTPLKRRVPAYAPPGGLFGPCGPLGPIQQAAGPAALTDKQRFLRPLPTCSALFTLHSALFQSLPASPASSLSRTGHRSAHRRPASSGDSST